MFNRARRSDGAMEPLRWPRFGVGANGTRQPPPSPRRERGLVPKWGRAMALSVVLGSLIRNWWTNSCWFRNGLTAYLLSTALVAVGVLLGVHLLKPSVGSHSIRHVPPSGDVYVDAMTRWDGQWLLQIATEGYTYDPYSQSSVALYPLYPCLVAMASRMASLPADVTGLLVSHAAPLIRLGAEYADKCRATSLALHRAMGDPEKGSGRR